MNPARQSSRESATRHVREDKHLIVPKITRAGQPWRFEYVRSAIAGSSGNRTCSSANCRHG